MPATPSHGGPATEVLRRRIDAVLDADPSELVREYFNHDRSFAAETFDILGENDPYRIGADDMAAVTLLDVSLPPPLVRSLVGSGGPAATKLLLDIDPEVPLWSAKDADLNNATELWSWLNEFDNVGPVIAGKLLARKRPHLIPIYDSIVETALQPPPGEFWTVLRSVLADQDLVDRINALQPADLEVNVSALRLLDVAMWMTGSKSENVKAVWRDLGRSR